MTKTDEHGHLLPSALMPLLAALLGLDRRSWDTRWPETMLEDSARVLRVRSDPMAVRTDDIALLDLGFKDHSVLQKDLLCGQAECLLGRVAMIKIHDVRWKAAAAVHTWDAPEIPQPLERRALSPHYPFDLSQPIPLVIPNVVWTLRLSRGHAA